ncbi:MAG: ABC transporter substrate-binding protein [Pseudomonadota bacterium]
MIARSLLLGLVAVTMLGSCSRGDPEAPVTMSVITAEQDLRAKQARPADQNGLITATAQGLVSFDGEGQIEPGLAERWIVTDDGFSIIFRIRRILWADGRPVTSAAVARVLQRLVAADRKNRLQPMLGTIDKIIPMTGQVLEIRLKSAQRDVLQLLAQPEMAITLDRPSNGTGPYRIHSVRDNVTRLRLLPPDGEEARAEAGQQDDIRIRREAGARAVARFAAREIGLVTGGRFNTLPLVRPAAIANNQFITDPAYGLFGFAVVDGSKALVSANVRRALAMAIDRERLVSSFGLSGWRAQYALLPGQLDSATAPAALEWVGLDKPARVARARDYLQAAGTVPVVRIALPSGPGSRLLFAAIAEDWRQVGIIAVRVGMNDAADLRLIDEVAPQRTALWFLSRFSCGRGYMCSTLADTAIRAALSTGVVSERAAAIAEADAAIASEQLFIPLALPLRWSLVSPELTGWRANSFAVHPLHHLRKARR